MRRRHCSACGSVAHDVRTCVAHKKRSRHAKKVVRHHKKR